MASLGSFIMQAGTVGLALVLLAVVVAVGQDVLNNLHQSQCTGTNYTTCFGEEGNWTGSTAASNVTRGGILGLDKVTDNMGTLAIVGVAAVIIGVLFASFGGFLGGRD